MSIDQPGPGDVAPVIDVSELEFEKEVIARSRVVPVVVDFWAPWCGPCRMLSPVLERLANEAQGAWVLAKVNVDHNQSVARHYGVQGIPAVKAFRDGRVVDEFVGAQPEPSVRDFVAKLLPSESDGLAREAHAKELGGDLAAAEPVYRRALEMQADHPLAMLGLGRVLVGLDRHDEAVEALERVPRGSAERPEAEVWLTQARFRRDSDLTGGEIEARRRLAADADDLEARLSLATALAAKGAHREALEGLFELMERDSGDYRNRARQAILDIFNLLGDRDDLTQEYRARLATLLW